MDGSISYARLEILICKWCVQFWHSYVVVDDMLDPISLIYIEINNIEGGEAAEFEAITT